MSKECDGSISVEAFSARECAAAHALHQTHLSWSRMALSSNPTGCYQCHGFARRVLVAAATYDALNPAAPLPQKEAP